MPGHRAREDRARAKAAQGLPRPFRGVLALRDRPLLELLPQALEALLLARPRVDVRAVRRVLQGGKSQKAFGEIYVRTGK